MTNLGHGANDANGVYLLGELDATGPYITDALNLAPASISAILSTLLSTVVRRTTTMTPGSTTGSPVVVPWDTTPIQAKANGITANTTSGTFVCTAAGTYLFEGVIGFLKDSANTRYVYVQKALAATPTTFTNDRVFVSTATGATFETTDLFRDPITLAVGDVVRIAASNTTTGTNTNSLIYGDLKVTRLA